MGLRISHLDEPVVEFGTGEASMIKEGLAAGGPYSLRLGGAHPPVVRVGFVGTKESVDGARAFLEKCSSPIGSGRTNLRLAPDFPGFESLMHSALALDPNWAWTVDADAFERAIARPELMAFEECLKLWANGVRELAQRDVRLDVVVCALPRDLLTKCARIERPRTRRRGPRHKRRRANVPDSNQLMLFSPDAASIEAASQPLPDDLTARNFRRALKAAAMEAKVPIQIVTPNLYEEGIRGQQDPATRAWNLSVALFYKAGGIPWRVKPESEHTCFVGISFHHLYTDQTHVVYSSLAQAFSTDADGFALRGDAMPWDASDRLPYLSEEQAHDLLGKVITAYRDRLGRDPLRVVVHKTSEFRPEERSGISRALASIPVVEMQTLRSTDFRLIRQGSYPPHRGTLCRFDPAAFLFTTGYSPYRQTYDGPHIPAPLELVGLDSTQADVAANEILGLTKMNWNSADDHTAFPISLAFARKVGLIMSEVPFDREPHPLYRFYM